MASARAAARAAAYAAAWNPAAGKNQGVSFPVDPSYPTVTGTQELKVEGDTLGTVGAQITSWPQDWGAWDPARSATAACIIRDGVFADEKHIAWSGQGEPLFVDRGSALGIQSGLTFFQVIKTGVISGKSTHATIFQASRGDSLARMSMVQRNDANDFLSYWDGSAGWLESSTSLADNTKYILSWRSDNTSMKLAVNGGAEEALGNPTHQQMEFYNIGSSTAATEPFIGLHAAVIVYLTHISDADRILIRDYLNAKYLVY
jgi:dihydrofolate reductase